MMGLLRHPYILALAGTKVCAVCRCPVWAQHLLLSRRVAAAPRPGSSGNVGRAARANHGDIQQGAAMGWREGSPQCRPAPLTARCCNSNGSVTGMSTRIAARARKDAAESLLPVIVLARAALHHAIATHGVADGVPWMWRPQKKVVAGTCGWR
jgi:hypothetical protein